MYTEIWVTFALLAVCFCQDIPLVELSHGTVIGLKVKSEAVPVDYYSFRGIPYASPPIGDLRFKTPKPAVNWTGILDARQDKSACMQKRQPTPFPYTISEDCLFLNVFTPYLKVPEGKSPLPVMVYIHGGAFIKGLSDSRQLGPDFFLLDQVVLVTISYRLGAFGFLNLELPGAQGNAGLKDQILALKWVKKEIRNFGGNPDSVTVFGNSAGGISAHCLYLSPLSKGLFHRIILQSGNVYRLDGINRPHTETALTLANALDCNATSSEVVLECLKSADAEAIVRATENITASNGKFIFYPTIEKDLGEDVVLPEDINTLNNRKYSKAPYMIGVNKDEGIYSLLVNNYTQHLEDLGSFLPLSIQESSQQIKSEAVKKLKEFYFNNETFSNETLREAIHLYTARYLYSTIQAVRATRSRANVYLYQFTFDGDIKYIDPQPLLKELNITGAAHTDELGYLFFSQRLKQNISRQSDESLVISRMIRLWTNFAKFGNPTPDKDETLGGVKWKPVTEANFRYLEIGKELIMKTSDLEEGVVVFWDSLYPSPRSSAFKCNGSLLFIAFTSVILYFV